MRTGEGLAASASVQRLQTALHAKAKEAPGFRFYSLSDKAWRDDVLPVAWQAVRRNGGAAVAASLKRFGWQQAIVADPKGVIVAGETRYKAAVLIGLTAAPVVTIPARRIPRHRQPDVRTHVLGHRPSLARAFRVIDNRTSELTSWDTDLLPDALSGLSDLDIFSFDDVLPLAVTAGKTDPDDIPETPKNPVTRTGNLWVLGKHRIVCGDSTDQKTVERMQRAIHNHQGDVGGRSGEALAFEQAATPAVILVSWRLNTLLTATYSWANYWSSRSLKQRHEE